MYELNTDVVNNSTFVRTWSRTFTGLVGRAELGEMELVFYSSNLTRSMAWRMSNRERWVKGCVGCYTGL